jgi:hypothetical protein
MMRRYVMTLEVIVTDHDRLMKAARDRAEESGCKRSLIKTEQDAVHWLLDPGSAFEDGFEIDNAGCERL